MADQPVRIGRAVHPAQRRPAAGARPSAWVGAGGALAFDDQAPRRAGPAAQQQPAEPASPPPAGPPQSVEEAQARFLQRYLPWLVALALGGEEIEIPETIEEWVALARAPPRWCCRRRLRKRGCRRGTYRSDCITSSAHGAPGAPAPLPGPRQPAGLPVSRRRLRRRCARWRWPRPHRSPLGAATVGNGRDDPWSSRFQYREG